MQFTGRNVSNRVCGTFGPGVRCHALTSVQFLRALRKSGSGYRVYNPMQINRPRSIRLRGNPEREWGNPRFKRFSRRLSKPNRWNTDASGDFREPLNRFRLRSEPLRMLRRAIKMSGRLE
jgi:hypothetical protein